MIRLRSQGECSLNLGWVTRKQQHRCSGLCTACIAHRGLGQITFIKPEVAPVGEQQLPTVGNTVCGRDGTVLPAESTRPLNRQCAATGGYIMAASVAHMLLKLRAECSQAGNKSL